jgi:hypothetical protein
MTGAHHTIFKPGKFWVFKQFFDDKEVFNALLDYYTRNNAIKLPE